METNRRWFLETLSSLPVVGRLLSIAGAGAGLAMAGSSSRDYFRELGVRRFINGAGTYTALTASLMPREVLEAIQSASRHYVALDELNDRVGERIAGLLECEAAMVTAGAASALTLGTAAVLTGQDEEKIKRLPDLSGMKSEVIIQKSHRFSYDHAVRSCGIRLIEVETARDVRRSVNGQTAMMMFLNKNNPLGQIRHGEFVELGKQLSIPTFNDCAADVPPAQNLFKYTQMGFDLVTFSGGKGLRGPQSAGLLLGRRDLIRSARLNTSPHGDTIGRGMKVNKEEILGMLVALELYLKRDHQAEWKEWENRARQISQSAISVPGVTAEVYLPEVANHAPHIQVQWNQGEMQVTPLEVEENLRTGSPSIEVKSSKEALQIGVWMMQPGESKVVARRLRQVLMDYARNSNPPG